MPFVTDRRLRALRMSLSGTDSCESDVSVDSDRQDSEEDPETCTCAFICLYWLVRVGVMKLAGCFHVRARERRAEQADALMMSVIGETSRDEESTNDDEESAVWTETWPSLLLHSLACRNSRARLQWWRVVETIVMNSHVTQ